MRITSTTNTRAALRTALHDALDDRLELAKKEVPNGEWEGVPVVTTKDLADVIAEVFGGALPPPDGRSAEVATPATVLVSAECPRCHIPGLIPLVITPELRVETTSSELRLHARAKPRAHLCGQTTLAIVPEVEGQAEAFDIGEDEVLEPDGEGPVATATPEPRKPHQGDRVILDGATGFLTALLADGTISSRFGRRVHIFDAGELEWHADELTGGYWAPAPPEAAADDGLLP